METPTNKKVAIVTGASRGIGRAISTELARSGYHVVINYRSDERGAIETRERVKQEGGNGTIMQFDVADPTAARAAIDAVLKNFESIDVLVNNAGITADGLFVLMPRRDWQAVIDVSLNGFYNMTKPVLEKMVVQKRGSIVSIASVAGLIGHRGQANYAAAKAGLIGASRVVASEVARLGVRVNVVAPGPIETEMIKNIPAGNIKALIPMARIGKPEEVATVVRFLCSEDASYITGQVISVNGGMF